MRPSRAFPIGIGLVLLAFGATLSTPPDKAIEAPFAETGAPGETIVSEHLVVTVHSVVLAREVEIGSWEGTTAGIWLVAEATAEGRVGPSTVDADLHLDGVRYPGTNRTRSETLDSRVVAAGFPLTGPVLIELPADVVSRPGARAAVLRIEPGSDTRLDSVVELRLDLTALDVRDRVELEATRGGAR